MVCTCKIEFSEHFVYSWAFFVASFSSYSQQFSKTRYVAAENSHFLKISFSQQKKICTSTNIPEHFHALATRIKGLPQKLTHYNASLTKRGVPLPLNQHIPISQGQTCKSSVKPVRHFFLPTLVYICMSVELRSSRILFCYCRYV